MNGAAKAAAGGFAALCAGFLALLVVLGMASGMGQLAQASSSCGQAGPAVTAQVSNVPGGSVAGYSGPQLAGAAEIMKAAADAGLDVKAQTIGVMTSMGESGLTPVNHGDLAGPDSLGWFQQRAPWGPADARLDPYRSATMFFTGGQGGQPGLISVTGWETMQPTLAAHAVQRNADPYYYTKYWDPAVKVVQALAGTSVQVTGVAVGAGSQVCTGQAPGAVAPGPGGWTVPARGTLSSGFGYRGATSVSPAEFHAGQDIAAPCGTPIYAAAAGTVISSGSASGFGDWIRIDHGGGLITVYGHMFPQDLMVHVGDKVTSGQQISRVGKNGEATGCHLHFEVHDPNPIDPVSFMAAHGAPL